MDWRVFPINKVLKLLNDSFVLERVTVKWDDETYGKSEGTRFVLCRREEVANIDHIKVCSSGFFHDTFVYYGDGLMLKLWQDNLNVDEEHERYSSNKLVSPLFSLYSDSIPDDSFMHRWLVFQGITEAQLDGIAAELLIDAIYAYDSLDKKVLRSDNGYPTMIQQGGTVYLSESEIVKVTSTIEDDNLRNRVLSVLWSKKRAVKDVTKENRDIADVSDLQIRKI
jgi:hypothetical protein